VNYIAHSHKEISNAPNIGTERTVTTVRIQRAKTDMTKELPMTQHNVLNLSQHTQMLTNYAACNLL